MYFLSKTLSRLSVNSLLLESAKELREAPLLQPEDRLSDGAVEAALLRSHLCSDGVIPLSLGTDSVRKLVVEMLLSAS
jgi:hypothetical protein